MDRSISILGCGWLGLELGRFLTLRDYEVKGSVTNPEKFDKLQAAGIKPFQIIFNPDINPDYSVEFFNSQTLIVNFPPKRREDVEMFHPSQINSLVQVLQGSKVENVLFVSSTSVYPNINREIVEDDDLPAEKGSGKALKLAEEILKRNQQFETTILRFAGLVGPDRQPGRFLAGKKDLPDGDAPVNLIHREDCIRLIYNIISQEAWGHTFNATAAKHPSRRHFYCTAAELIGLEKPHFSDSAPSSFKIINSDKVRNYLKYSFMYDDPIQMITNS